MERRISVRTLNQQTSTVLTAVASGAAVTITNAGSPVARLVPLPPGLPEGLARLIARGEAAAPVEQGPFTLPPGTRHSDVNVAAALTQLREEERW
ncbi:MAG: type II toxin-antitoxin system Phd/YefM family antitoxin [Chloroflexota bacterium]